MVDEDVAGLRRALTGEPMALCDLCGRAVPPSSLVKHSGLASVAEPVEIIHVCAECRARIALDDVPFDEEIAAGLQEADE